MIVTDPHFPGLSRLGALLADPGRAAMLWALMDGSAHLARLTDGGLLALGVRGRHRYYRIASPEVASSIETLANLAQATAPLRSVPIVTRTVPLEMRHARTCYDHMAGELAMRVYDSMRERGWLAAADGLHDLEVTPFGADELARRWRIDVGAQRRLRRRFACTRLDWSERRAHLAGALGDALLDAWLAQRWIEPAGQPRVLRITPDGQRRFEALLTGA